MNEAVAQRKAPTRQTAAGEPPLLSVVMPAYNEVATIGEILRRVAENPLDKEVVVVDDGSTDGTAEEVEKFGGAFSISAAVRPPYYKYGGCASCNGCNCSVNGLKCKCPKLLGVT